MTKRPSPFDTNICRQSKIHLNNYENDLKALKSIEEQTLRKLIEGSKKSHSIILKNDEVNLNCDNLLQKCVTHYFTVNGKKVHENGRILKSCLAGPKCFFCEKNTDLIHQCVECLEFYCNSCSFVLYDSLEDKRVCLSCS